MACPAGQKSWAGKCLTPEEVQKIGPCLCRQDERWLAEKEGCVCKYRPLMKRDNSGNCVVNQSSVTVLSLVALGAAGLFYYVSAVR